MPTWLWIIIINGVVLSLIGYVWRSMEQRVNSIEADAKEEDKELMKNPVMTVSSHQKICDSNMKSVEEMIEKQGNLLCDKIMESETRTALLIENAILKATKKKVVVRAPVKGRSRK